MSIFTDDKFERFTPLGRFINETMQGLCESDVEREIQAGRSYRQAMARVGRNNPFRSLDLSNSLEIVKVNHPEFGDVRNLNQDELDSVWMSLTVDICLSNII